jgi:membrane fusion protein, multidrug efflux system
MKKSHLVISFLALVGAGVLAWYVQRDKVASPDVSLQGGASTDKPAGAGTGPGAGGRPPVGPPGGGPGGPGGRGPGGPAAVEVGLAVSKRLEDDAQAVGAIRARRSVVVRPEVSGRVARLEVADGARVRQGQLLVQLDDTLQRAQLQQAEAQSTIAKTNLQRSKELASQNFVSQSAVDQQAAALDVAAAQVALVQAQLSRMRIVAPFDAVAGIRTAQVGDYLKDGADIVTLDDVGSVFLDFRLPERYVPRIKPGKPVEAEIDALPGRKFSGVVMALDSQVDANGRSLLVRAELRNSDGALRPGMFARARVVFGVQDKAIMIPEEALVPLGGAQFVYKVAQGANGPVSQKLTAKIGLRQPGQVQILEGLEAGDKVVTAGHSRLARGDNLPLRVIDLDKPASGPRKPPGGPAAAGSAPASAPGSSAS